MLKERLRRAHPSLIYKDVSKTGADAITVDFDQAINWVSVSTAIRG